MSTRPGAEFDDFVRTRTTALLRVAYLLTGDQHASEDLVQEVLEQIYLRWRRINGSPGRVRASGAGEPVHEPVAVARPAT